MLNKIKNCLKNENAGPNLETMIAFGFASIVIVAFYRLGRQIWYFVHTLPVLPDKEGGTGTNLIIGYNSGQ